MKRALTIILMLTILTASPVHAVSVQEYKALTQAEQGAYYIGALEMALSIHRGLGHDETVDCIKDYFGNNAEAANHELSGMFNDPDVQQYPAAAGIEILINRHCGNSE